MPAAMEVDKENVESGASADGKAAVAAPVRTKGASADDNREAFSPELLRLYYSRLFPYDQVCLCVCLSASTCVSVCLSVGV